MPLVPDVDAHVALLRSSLQALTGTDLAAGLDLSPGLAAAVDGAPFALVSHDTADDPVFCYANRTALRLFELDLDAFTRLPSRLSAEPLARAERDALLARVARDGVIDDYAGVRVSASGRRFAIEGAVVWNVVDAAGRYRGQAALFDRWTYLQEEP